MMPDNYSPPQPLPGPLEGKEINSFAYDTIVRRLPDMLLQTIDENEFPPESLKRLQQLWSEIPYGLIRPLSDSHAPDERDWNSYLQPYIGQDWLHIPWFLAEAYFFRRIIEATGYFQPGPGLGFDPYFHQKTQALEQNEERIASAARQVEAWLQDPDRQEEAIRDMMLLNVWGNQADLSLWPVGGELRPDHQQQDDQQAHLLVDDRNLTIEYLCADPSSQPGSHKRVDFIIDNAGLELTLDLCLVDLLLSSGAAQVVRLHLKFHPTYISDALNTDVQWTVEQFSHSTHAAVRSLGERLHDHLLTQRLELAQNLFWNSSLPAWEMPAELRFELGEAHLVISKGDMNYRRLLGDRHWEHTRSFADIVRYYPTAVLALRVLKSELCVGLEAEQVRRLAAQDPQWLTNGRWAVIQFAKGGAADRRETV